MIHVLHSLWSNTFTSSELESCFLFDVGDIDKPKIIDCFKHTISSHSRSSEHDTDFFESHIVSRFLHDVFRQNFSSVWSILLCSLETSTSCTTTRNFVSFLVCKCHNSVVFCCFHIQNTRSDLESLLFLRLFFGRRCCHN